ncbi:MAG: 16S rRNA (adenine(1518)-N(6)/adenine(1519)-N(6))-dimethyltransferase [Planctomycetes bacterium]|nr:16S rRNA (adenine(1518)-N(6)/adenine(1519)-N(6))-dimethyltransferase [Planctomycetota bacterium]
MKVGELRRLLADRGLAPAKGRGQNFLVDPALLAAIPRDAGVVAGERVLEIGPGAGALTERLLEAGAELLAVELDHGLAALLRERLAPAIESGSLVLVEGDVLGADGLLHDRVEEWWPAGPPPRLVANLPYAITGPFLGRLPGRPMLGACLLLQREVARKALSGPAGGPLGVRLELAFHGRLGRRVPPEVFWPAPQVESAFLHLEPRADAPSVEVDRKLRELLRLAFSQRRKRLLPRLAKLDPAAAAALEQAGADPSHRPEQLSSALWLAAARNAIILGS